MFGKPQNAIICFLFLAPREKLCGHVGTSLPIHCITCINLQTAHQLLWKCGVWGKASLSHFYMPFSVHQDNSRKKYTELYWKHFNGPYLTRILVRFNF